MTIAPRPPPARARHRSPAGAARWRTRRDGSRMPAGPRRTSSGRSTRQDKLWILQARPMTALPPDVSWDSPAPGAYTRMLRFGEWIGEPVTPLFESWLLTRDGGAHARALPGADRPDRAAAVPRRGQRLVLLLDQLHLRGRLRSAACRACWCSSFAIHATSPGSSRRPFATAFPIVEREWREDLQPRYRAAVADAEGRVETLPVAELPALIDELAELAGEYFASIAALSGAAYKLEMNLAQFYRRHLAALARRQPPAAARRLRTAGRSGRAMPSRRSTGGTRRSPLDAAATTPAETHGRVVEARQAAEAAAFAALASSPRRLRAFRRLLADAQHLVPIREEQTDELTIAWPVMRRAVLRIGEALAARGVDRRAGRRLLPDARRGRSRRSDGAACRRPSTCRLAGRCGTSRPRLVPPLLVGRVNPMIQTAVGQLPEAHRRRPVGHGARVGRAGVAGSRHRARFA